MSEILKGLLRFMLFFAGQSLILAMFAGIVWDLLLAKEFGIQISYLQWFGIIFIVNLLRFDFVERVNNSNKFMEYFNNNYNTDNTEDNEIQ